MKKFIFLFCQLLVFVSSTKAQFIDFDFLAMDVLTSAKRLSIQVQVSNQALSRTLTSANQSNIICYQQYDKNYKFFTWTEFSNNLKIVDKLIFSEDMSLIRDSVESTSPDVEELLLIDIQKQVNKLLESGDFDIDSTSLIQAYNIEEEFIEVYLLRQELNPNVIPLGTNIYLQFDRIGDLKFVEILGEEYMPHPAKATIEGDDFNALAIFLLEEDPIVSEGDLCAVLSNKDRINWGEFLTLRPYDEQNHTRSTFDIKEETLLIEIVPNDTVDVMRPIPFHNIMVVCGHKRFFCNSDSLDVVELLDNIEESWMLGYNVIYAEDVVKKYPSMRSHHMIVYGIKRNKFKLLPPALKSRFK
ncbi:MAG: hypothetical protein JXR10_16975 [Cyclobacteriaceae bacterium]